MRATVPTRLLALLLSLLSLLLPALTSGGVDAAPLIEEDGPHLKSLTSATFADAIKEGMSFVEFYSPYCGHCKKFAPTFKSLAEIQEHWEETGFKIRRVNCVTSGDICQAQKVTGYPSMFLYKEGDLVDQFKGDRSFEKLMAYTTAHASDYRKERADQHVDTT